MTPRPILFFLALFACGIQSNAEIFKCTNAAGAISYQSTSCGAAQQTGQIDRRFSNSLPLGVSEEDAVQVSRIASEAEKALKERRARHNEYMRRVVRDFEARQAACADSRSKLDRLRAKQREKGRSHSDELSDAITDMRDACSG